MNLSSPRGRLLLVDDERTYRVRLERALEQRGFECVSADSFEEGWSTAHSFLPDYAVLDLKLGDGDGLKLATQIRSFRPNCRILIVTGFGNIASAVAAVKLGAVDYLAKPANADQIVDALLANDPAQPDVPENPMPADRIRWEHIQRVYNQCGGNVSATARTLNMHRRTLQRILGKRAPLEQVS